MKRRLSSPTRLLIGTAAAVLIAWCIPTMPPVKVILGVVIWGMMVCWELMRDNPNA
jgi:hypothetical protein